MTGTVPPPPEDTTRNGSRPFQAVLWVLALALVARLVAVGLAAGWEQPPSDKALRYDPVARSLLDGDGFARKGAPTAVSPPVYPLLLAAVYAVAGESPTVVRTVLALLDTLHCLVWIMIAWRLLGRRIALLVGIAMAVCPYFLYLVVTAGSDGPFLLLHAVFLAALISAWRTGSLGSYAAAGLAAGVATLCRAVSLFEPFYLVPLLVLAGARDRRRLVGASAAMLAVFLLTLTPWTVRNWVHFGRLVPIQTLGGRTLLISNYDRGDSSYKEEVAKAFQDRDTWANRDEKLMQRGVALILENPGAFALRCAKRLFEMWGSTYNRRFDLQLGLANAVLLIFAGIGLFRLRRRWRELLPLLAAASYFILFHSLMYVLFRYLLPVVPVLIMLAAAAVQPRSVLLEPGSSGVDSRSCREPGDGPSQPNGAAAGP